MLEPLETSRVYDAVPEQAMANPVVWADTHEKVGGHLMQPFAPPFNHFHSHNYDSEMLASLGNEHGAGPYETSTSTNKLVIRKKLFKMEAGDSFKIKQSGGLPFGNKIFVQATHDELVLIDGRSLERFVVCYREVDETGQSFHIYSMDPLYEGQEKSDRKFNESPLYAHSKVTHVPSETVKYLVTLENETKPSYSVYPDGTKWNKKFVVEHHDQPAGLIEDGTWEGFTNTHLVTVNGGIDPCLMVCLAAICDEKDPNEPKHALFRKQSSSASSGHPERKNSFFRKQSSSASADQQEKKNSFFRKHSSSASADS